MTTGAVAGTLDGATLEKLVAAAVAAPSIHNTQPWRFRLDPATTTVEVHAAADRGLDRIDPTGRGLHVSAGAALFNLRAAVAHFGWEPVIRLLPRSADPGRLAAVRLAGPRGLGGRHEEAELYDAVWRRHSSRVPFSGPPVPYAVRDEIVAAAAVEDTHLVFPGTQETARVLHLTSEAEWRGLADPARAAESRAWVRDGSASGVPTAALPARDSSGRMPVRDFSAGVSASPRQPAAYEQRPTVAVLGTKDDGPADWLRAGQGLERALLVATAHGVRASLFSQAVEWPDLRWALRDPREEYVHVQMVIRFGYGPEGPATPRRSVHDVLDTGG
ncbi:Acg family FMN-binding oxidoreductase [Streptomyces sp. NPDC020983]|uniref:Acg family FMN-binding oxidoreductase n=1 Tax=Streptomyces sp. NPDC020983 TaxID=3365106 RepID=UPI0037B9C030